MNFGSVPLADALGAILAHSTRVGDGVIKKGRILGAGDLQRLAAAGHKTVIAARLAADDVLEDAAAERIAALVTGSGTRSAAPFTGRANIFASADGLARIESQALQNLNAIDERITLATVADYTRVVAGQMLATVKIIPFAVPVSLLAEAERRIPRGLCHLLPFQAQRAGLILTAFEATRSQVLDRRRDAVRERIEALGGTLAETATVAHTEAAVRDAISKFSAQNLSPILIFAASAIVDRADVIPAGLVAAGGHIERLGMPVDPGNLLLLGRLGSTPVIGLPSCAGSLKLNGFDWVLERTLAGLTVSSTDIAAMGLGGLLKEIDSRPQPRLGNVAASDTLRHAPRIAAVVLAAGRSTRMGANKLLADVGGTPLVRRTVMAALASDARPVVVVVGHQADAVRAALTGLDVTFIENPQFAEGLSSSLRAGLTAVPHDCDGAMILLGDMPEISSHLLDRLSAAFAPKEGRSIIVPVDAGKRGNPILWARSLFAEMAEVAGDTGAKHLLGVHADLVVEIPADAAVLTDVDTPAALAALRERHQAG